MLSRVYRIIIKCLSNNCGSYIQVYPTARATPTRHLTMATVEILKNSGLKRFVTLDFSPPVLCLVGGGHTGVGAGRCRPRSRGVGDAPAFSGQTLIFSARRRKSTYMLKGKVAKVPPPPAGSPPGTVGADPAMVNNPLAGRTMSNKRLSTGQGDPFGKGVEMVVPNPMMVNSGLASPTAVDVGEQPPPELHAVVSGSDEDRLNGVYHLVTYRDYAVTKVSNVPGSLYFRNPNTEAVLTRQRVGEKCGWVIGLEGKAYYGAKTEDLMPPQGTTNIPWKRFSPRRMSFSETVSGETLKVLVRRPKSLPKNAMEQATVDFETINTPRAEAEDHMFDVGSSEAYTLSWALKEKAIEETVPRMKKYDKNHDDDASDDSNADSDDDDFEWAAYPATPRTGWHCVACCDNAAWKKSQFEHHGIGIVLYFKFLRWLIFTFFFMALVVTPSIYVIRDMGTPDPLLTQGTGILATTTLGNLGEGSRVCEEAYEGGSQNLTVRCAEGSISTILTAYMGHPTGQCGCPAAQKPDVATGECKKPAEGVTCVPGEFCLEGYDPSLKTPCCSGVADPASQRASFMDLMPRANATCNSIKAMSIVNAMCLGKKSCSINVDRFGNYTWEDHPDTSCADDDVDADKPICRTSFDAGKNGLSQCINSTTPMRLIVVATCDAEYVEFHEVKKLAQEYGYSIRTTFLKADVKLGLSLMQWLSVLIFMLSIKMLQTKEKEQIDELDEAATTLTDYTVYVEGLPDHKTEDLEQLKHALKETFERGLNDERTRDSGMQEWIDAQSKREENGQEREKIEVFKIWFGLNNKEAILKMKERGQLIRRYEIQKAEDEKKERSRAKSLTQADFDGMAGKAPPPPATNSCCDKVLIAIGCKEAEGAKLEELKRQIHDIEETIKNKSFAPSMAEQVLIDKGLKEMPKKTKGYTAVAAFVAFKQEEGYLRALEEYPESALLRCCQDERFKLLWPPLKDDDHNDETSEVQHEVHQKRYSLRVRAARDPSEVIWENLQVTKNGRRCRGAITTTLAFILILVTFAFSVTAKNQKARVDRQYPPVKCDSNFPPSKLDVVLDEEYNLPRSNKTIKEGFLSCYCEKLAAEANYWDLVQQTVSGNEESNIETVWNTKFRMGNGEDKTLCVDWMLAQSEIQFYSSVAVAGIVVVNMGLTSFLRMFSNFESHHFRTDVLASLMTKLFSLKLLNTGVVVLLVNAHLEDIGAKIAQDPNLPLFAGSYGDFNMGWYYGVGVSIIVTMMVNSVSFVIWPVLGAFSGWKARCCDRGCTYNKMKSKKKTQHDYNSLFIGPEFALADRYATCLNDMFVIMMYAGGMPILLWVGFVGATLRFYVDRWSFVRLYRKPPEYDATVAIAAEKFFPYAGLLQLMFSMWMYTNPSIFGSRSSALVGEAMGATGGELGGVTDSIGVFGRLMKMPFHLVFAALIVAWLVFWKIVWRLFSRIILTLLPCLSNLSCTRKGEGNLNLDKVINDDKIFTGLKSYDMESNPLYKEAFAKDSVAGEKAGFTRFSISTAEDMEDLGAAIDDILANNPVV
jgi:bacterioferritin (cytochrome b1)